MNAAFCLCMRAFAGSLTVESKFFCKNRRKVFVVTQKSSTFAADLCRWGRKSESWSDSASRSNRINNYFNKMYVIVEINGQQFKAEEGKKLFVHHIKDVEAQATVEFEKVLLVDNNGTITVGAPVVEGAKVVCEVVTPLVKGDKVLVFHKRRRKGYRKLNGHRQQFTELTIKQVIA